MILPKQVHKAISLLETSGFEGYLVGGAVRDFVRGKQPSQDWDLTTNALPKQLLQVFKNYHLIETGLQHGTVTVVIDNMPLEITTYRVDGEYTDNRHPDHVYFTTSLEQDLARRDFTMNAMAYNPKTGIVDPFGGKKDIEEKIVRCVGDAKKRFCEDGLRILRALRFASVFDMQLHADTALAVFGCMHLLKNIAAERIQTEFTKLLCGKNVNEILTKYADVFAVFIPELAPMFQFCQHNPHHDKDVWSHTVQVVASVFPQPVLRWAALLHDIGKPNTFTCDKDGIGHFYGHADASTHISANILARLRFDNYRKARILHLVEYHDVPVLPQPKAIRRMLAKHGEEIFEQLIELHKADTAGQAKICRERLKEYDAVMEIMQQLVKEQQCFSLKDLAINGKDVQQLGFCNKEIGAVLKLCLQAVVEEQQPNQREALLFFAKTLVF